MDFKKILEAASDTKRLEIGDGILPVTAEVFKDLFPGKHPVIISDPSSYAIVGEQVQKIFEEAGLNPEKPILLTDPDLHAEWKHIEKLDKALSETDAIPVAVGSGTINDLTKLSAEHVGKRYITVATAASMDGYTAFGASVIKDGAKQTFSCRAPLAAVADTNIIAEAPASMTASGYADLFAKIPAGADWILADALGVEPMDDFSFNIVQGGLKKALGNPKAVAKGDKEAIHDLIEGLLLGGFAMQAHKTSRPASGADHQFSHLWNMENHVMKNGHAPSHGFQVSIGLLASTALYEQFLATDFSKLDVEAAVEAWPSLEELQKEAAEAFADTDFPEIGVKEVTAKYSTKEELRKQLTLLKENWPQIKEKLEHQLIPLSRAKEMLAIVGAPTKPEDIDVSPEYLIRSVMRAEKIRRRFTIFDIALRTGNLQKWADNIKL